MRRRRTTADEHRAAPASGHGEPLRTAWTIPHTTRRAGTANRYGASMPKEPRRENWTAVFVESLSIGSVIVSLVSWPDHELCSGVPQPPTTRRTEHRPESVPRPAQIDSGTVAATMLILRRALLCALPDSLIPLGAWGICVRRGHSRGDRRCEALRISTG